MDELEYDCFLIDEKRSEREKARAERNAKPDYPVVAEHKAKLAAAQSARSQDPLSIASDEAMGRMQALSEETLRVMKDTTMDPAERKRKLSELTAALKTAESEMKVAVKAKKDLVRAARKALVDKNRAVVKDDPGPR